MTAILIDNFLNRDELEIYNNALRNAEMVSGAISAGDWAKSSKQNQQATLESTQDIGAQLVEKLFDDVRIARSSFPHRAVQPTFNLYNEGDYYKLHEDNPIQSGIRADLSYTLFLNSPSDYEGGELRLGDPAVNYKGDAGSIVLYDAGTPHEVRPIIKGHRIAAVGWLQSVIKDASQRQLLCRFHGCLNKIVDEKGVEDEIFQDLNRTRTQLMRMWAEV